MSNETLTLLELGATAAATIILAGATWWLAKSTKRLVGENMKMIAAAESEAKASLATVEEIRRDRELGYQPYLSFEIQRFTAVWLDAQPDMVNVVNYGRGPA